MQDFPIVSDYFCVMKKYDDNNLFITYLPRKMKWDSYYLLVFCSAEIIPPLFILIVEVHFVFWSFTIGACEKKESEVQWRKQIGTGTVIERLFISKKRHST